MIVISGGFLQLHCGAPLLCLPAALLSNIPLGFRTLKGLVLVLNNPFSNMNLFLIQRTLMLRSDINRLILVKQKLALSVCCNFSVLITPWSLLPCSLPTLFLVPSFYLICFILCPFIFLRKRYRIQCVSCGQLCSYFFVHHKAS